MSAQRQASLPFALPDIGEDEIDAVVAAMRTGWVTTGPRAREFETSFADMIGGGVEAVAVNSATAGLHLALEALGVGPGDKVLVPAWTFTATAEVVRYVGAEVELVDVDPATLNIDLEHASSLVDERTKVLLPVHFAGLPVSAAALAGWKQRHPHVRVVEDAAHAFPAASEGVPVGAGASDVVVFSFYATKTIATGEGGMLVTRDPEVARRARVMRLHGIDRDAFNRYRSDRPAWRYDVVAPGYKYNLTDTAAAMGLVQLRRAEEMRARREVIALRYLRAFSDLPVEMPATGADDLGGLHAWHLFVLRLEASRDRDRFISALADLGIGTSVHFIPLHMLTYWRGERGPSLDEQLPVATREFKRVVSLPIYSRMTDGELSRVMDAVRQVLR
ncbi:DegT/DnrJ/EryC1/StrS family aminotransferase [Terrabacter sp. 2RAF25]|uniref:DegT/DnrJ/EryC1/StrS family aminotransferase n=1 Tax=Terrabacter sp. 2RAF25 TaxID=3232998 RepID=UPI003F9C03C1